MVTCCLCYREEKASAPDGTINYPARTNYPLKVRTSGILCSNCTSTLLQKRIGIIPWDGNITTKSAKKLRRRKVNG
jgi:hypothetical protein